MPVKLSDGLVKLARKEAEAADRSITAQIEHWAKLGRAVESALRHDDLSALKRAAGNLDKAFPGAAAREAIQTVLRELVVDRDRSGLSHALANGRVVYQSDRQNPGLLTRIAPDGTRTSGQFQGRKFAPVRRTRHTSAR